MFQSIVWSSESLPLRQFVDKFTLPQLVKVEEGIYSQADLKTISTGQILTLHFTKRTDKLVINAEQQKEYLIPVNCPCKVEVLPTICEDRYYSIEGVLHDFPKFIRVVSDGPPSLGLRAGDILELKNTVEENHSKFLECERQDKTRDRVRLPLNLLFAFEPLERTGEYHLQELLQSLPARVKFTSSNTTIEHENQEIPLRSLGSVMLKEKREESTIIASSREEGMVTVLTIPVDLDVDVLPALGAIVGDKTYARFCKTIHDGTELEKVEDVPSFKLSEVDDGETVEMIYDYYDYEEVKPVVPPRCPRQTARNPDEDNVTPITSSSIVTLEPSSRESKPASKAKVTECPPPVARKPAKRPQTLSTATSSPVTPERPPGPKEENCTEPNPHNSVSAGADSDEEYVIPVDSPRSPPLQIPQTSDDSESGGSDDYETVELPSENTSQTSEPLPYNNSSNILPCHAPVDSNPSTGEDSEPVSQPPVPIRSCSLPQGVQGLANTCDDEDNWPSSDEDPYHDYLEIDKTPIPCPNAPEPVHTSNTKVTKKKSMKSKISSLFKSSPRSPPTSPSHASDKQFYPAPVFTKASSTVDSFPEDLEKLSVSEVGDCLRKLKMSEYVDNFADNQVDGAILKTFEESDLNSLQIHNALHRKKLMRFVKGWRPNLN